MAAECDESHSRAAVIVRDTRPLELRWEWKNAGIAWLPLRDGETMRIG
jgi:hypothetical protein